MSPCLFNLYAEYMKQNSGLDEANIGIRLLEEISTNFRYAKDTTLMAEREEELKSLLMKVKREGVNAGLKLSIQKTKIRSSSPIMSWQIVRKKVERVTYLFVWAPKSLRMLTAAMKLKDSCSLKEKL